MNLTQKLIESSESAYRDFTLKLVPDTKYEVLGVRVPLIKQIAKNSVKEDGYGFLKEEHKYYEEWFLHGLIIGYLKLNDQETLSLLEKFLPHIDNWAICDSVAASLKKLKKNTDLIYSKINEWLNSEFPYVRRFALVIALDCLNDFIKKNKVKQLIDVIKGIKTDNYYINMALSWLYCEILVKDYDSIIPLIESKSLCKFVQNKTIRKAVESFRITEEQKTYLRSLKI